MVCADSELAALDRRLDAVLRSSLEVLSRAADSAAALAELRAYQRGWISGRDECWKAPDLRGCVRGAYRTRIASLEAEFGLRDPTGTVFWTCEGDPANEFVTTFFASDPPSARMERGDRTMTFLRVEAGAGERYSGPFGRSLLIVEDSARIEWPGGEVWRCEELARR